MKGVDKECEEKRECQGGKGACTEARTARETGTSGKQWFFRKTKAWGADGWVWTSMPNAQCGVHTEVQRTLALGMSGGREAHGDED